MTASAKSLSLPFFVGIIAATSISSACLVGGDDVLWNNPLGGAFSAPLNWLPEIVPGVLDSAFFDTDELYTVSFSQNITNDTAVVDGDFVTFSLSGFTYTVGDLFVGEHLTEVGQLTVVGGHLISNAEGFTRIGKNIGSEGELIVTSTGIVSTFNDLLIGDAGIGVLTIQPGGTVSSDTVFIGDDAGSDGSVLVTGSNAQWNLSGNLLVANNGTGELTIASGGSVSCTTALLGDDSDADGSVLVTGSNAQWNLSGNLTVAINGTGELTIANGGSVSSASALIGDNPSADGTVFVTGTNAQWNLSGDLTVANDGTGELTIANGGSVSSASALIGDNTSGDGSVLVTGPLSHWNLSGDLTIANNGTGVLAIASGANVSGATAFIGDSPGANGSVLVTGTNALWNLSGDLIIANNGSGEMTIASGANVAVQGLVKVGDLIDANGSIIITGAGSNWITNGGFSLGNNKIGTLSITNGGTAEHHKGLTRIGNNIGSNGSVSIDGPGSTWTCSTELFIGNFSIGSLSIDNGAAAFTNRVKIGDEIGAIGIATINGKGSLWNDNVEIFVGNFGTGTVTVSNGALVSANATTIGDDPGSSGAIIVQDAGSTWTSSSSFTNGDLGNGLLQISDNGHVQVGSYLQSSDGTLNIQIGPAFITSVNSSGNAQLTGSLTISLTAGYTPASGEQFTILSANSRNGTFSQINAPDNLEVSYESDAVIVTVTDAQVCPADLDNSGSVGTSDLLILFAQWGTNGPADLDGSGSVGTSDLLILFANWGPCK